MSDPQYGPLPSSEEDALHSTRLLAIEERPFQRVIRRLLDPDSILRILPAQLPSPPPDTGDLAEAPAHEDAGEREALKRQTFRDEVLLDFANLESSITRIQLIQTSNARERERYAAEKAKILATAESVRSNTLTLREQLADAQKVLQLRKGYDELALKVLADKRLKARDEASSDIATLQKEIEELEAEGREVDGLWVGRKEQFERIVHEGEVMRRVIKGIKEPDEVEAEDKDDDDEAMEGADASEEHRDRSRLGSPAVGGDRTPRPSSGNFTPSRSDEDVPAPDQSGNTPLPASQMESDSISDRPHNKLLDVDNSTQASSRIASPTGQIDVEMSDDTAVEIEAARTDVQMKVTADQDMDES